MFVVKGGNPYSCDQKIEVKATTSIVKVIQSHISLSMPRVRRNEESLAPRADGGLVVAEGNYISVFSDLQNSTLKSMTESDFIAILDNSILLNNTDRTKFGFEDGYYNTTSFGESSATNSLDLCVYDNLYRNDFTKSEFFLPAECYQELSFDVIFLNKTHCIVELQGVSGSTAMRPCLVNVSTNKHRAFDDYVMISNKSTVQSGIVLFRSNETKKLCLYKPSPEDTVDCPLIREIHDVDPFDLKIFNCLNAKVNLLAKIDNLHIRSAFLVDEHGFVINLLNMLVTYRR
ncbi:hypothetical protein PCE1_004432 [Barthelona sp. PCE]